MLCYAVYAFYNSAKAKGYLNMDHFIRGIPLTIGLICNGHVKYTVIMEAIMYKIPQVHNILRKTHSNSKSIQTNLDGFGISKILYTL